MKASELYDWLFAEGEHRYNCQMMVDSKYIVDSYILVKEGRSVVELSDSPSFFWSNEDIPCLFNVIPLLDKTSVIKITCSPMCSNLSYKEIQFKASDWVNDITVNPLNSTITN